MDSRLQFIRDSFGLLFLVSNTLETVTDRYLAPKGLTTKQFFLSLILIQNAEPLSLSEAARILGSSRQNIKQLAVKLEKIGFCRMNPGSEDKRVLYLEATAKNRNFWKKMDTENIKYLETIFQELTDSELEVFSTVLHKLYGTVQER